MIFSLASEVLKYECKDGRKSRSSKLKCLPILTSCGSIVFVSRWFLFMLNKKLLMWLEFSIISASYFKHFLFSFYLVMVADWNLQKDWKCVESVWQKRVSHQSIAFPCCLSTRCTPCKHEGVSPFKSKRFYVPHLHWQVICKPSSLFIISPCRWVFIALIPLQVIYLYIRSHKKS